jgi:hypothetical protein
MKTHGHHHTDPTTGEWVVTHHATQKIHAGPMSHNEAVSLVRQWHTSADRIRNETQRQYVLGHYARRMCCVLADGTENHADWATLQPGDIIRVSGYSNGRRQRTRVAVVVADDDGYGHPAVWFYTRGAPELGTTVQPLWNDSAYAYVGPMEAVQTSKTLLGWERKLSPHTGMLHRFGWIVHETRMVMHLATVGH